MCSLKFSILIYIYFFNQKKFFSNHLNRVDNTFARLLERGASSDRAQLLEMEIVTFLFAEYLVVRWLDE